MAPITLFDASQHSTHFAAEVKGFDPLAWVEKKDVKKMDRFIQFAVAAADFAVKDSGLADRRRATPSGSASTSAAASAASPPSSASTRPS